MSGPRQKTIQQVEQLRDLAEQGVWQKRAAEIVGVRESRAAFLAKRHGFVFLRKPRLDAPHHRALRDGFGRGLTPALLAELTGLSRETVSGTLSKMGLTKGRRPDPGRYRRGYDVPDHLYPRYRELKALGLTFKEAGYELGLLERPAAKTQRAA